MKRLFINGIAKISVLAGTKPRYVVSNDNKYLALQPNTLPVVAYGLPKLSLIYSSRMSQTS